jgi:hypothetical protein
MLHTRVAGCPQLHPLAHAPGPDPGSPCWDMRARPWSGAGKAGVSHDRYRGLMSWPPLRSSVPYRPAFVQALCAMVRLCPVMPYTAPRWSGWLSQAMARLLGKMCASPAIGPGLVWRLWFGYSAEALPPLTVHALYALACSLPGPTCLRVGAGSSR